MLRARLGILIALAGCVEPAPPIEPQVTSRVAHLELAVWAPKQIDLLFVIDSSPAMRAHQDRLRAQAADFMAVMSSLQGGLPSLHVGVITTDVGVEGRDGSAGPPVPGCAGDGDGGRMSGRGRVAGPFLVDAQLGDRTRVRNYEGALADAFTALADVGIEGCAYTRPLEAIRRALDGNLHNVGFRRDDAQLAVIVITAEDDCSFLSGSFVRPPIDSATIDTFACVAGAAYLTDLEDEARFLTTSVADPSNVRVSVIAGPALPFERTMKNGHKAIAPSCRLDDASAQPARRLAAFAERFPSRSAFTSLCQPSLIDGLSIFAELPTRFPQTAACTEAPLADTDESRDGVQPACAVWYRFDDPARAERSIPACTDDRRPCWVVEEDPANCPGGDSLAFHVRPTPDLLPRNTRVIADCLVE